MPKSYSWYSNYTSLDSPDTIHQIFALGTLADIKSLRNIVGEKELKNIFITYPKKIYTVQTLNFIKKFILHISTTLDDQKYLKYTPRYTGQ